MNGDRQARSFDAIVRVVVEILESEGYDAVQPRVVAKRARVSLSTIYKFAPTREELIVTVLGRWMQANSYSGMAAPPTHASLYEGLMWVYRQIFEPWERNPRMLEAYYRAMTGPGGERLDQGMAVVGPVAGALLEKMDPTYAEDIGLIMTNMACGLIQRAAVGELAVSDILPMLERTLFRLTTNNEPLVVAARRRRATRRRRKA
jgi:AcrR family transcriptional regulator